MALAGLVVEVVGVAVETLAVPLSLSLEVGIAAGVSEDISRLVRALTVNHGGSSENKGASICIHEKEEWLGAGD